MCSRCGHQPHEQRTCGEALLGAATGEHCACPDSRPSDPWDGLLKDLIQLGPDAADPGIVSALVTFWKGRAGAAPPEIEVSDVQVLRAAIRDVPAVDWTKDDDLTRYAVDILMRLPDGWIANAEHHDPGYEGRVKVLERLRSYIEDTEPGLLDAFQFQEDVRAPDPEPASRSRVTDALAVALTLGVVGVLGGGGLYLATGLL